ncbi:similar to stage II sporulation protein D [Synechococcus elongatus PCC 6301]|uniref:Similar to stage II sporulation protein D n=2 Tax=Synechococcus elongatus TaxID=32046 RepID=A0A0H3K4F8_SYNP6|nr:similar to stage II sporulation protein D [Synechococcus elongatus PCC 6301]
MPMATLRSALFASLAAIAVLPTFSPPASAQAAPTIRVGIAIARPQIRVGSSTPAIIRNEQGQQIGQLPTQQGSYAQPSANGQVQLGSFRARQIWLEPTNDGLVWVGDRWYRGRLQLILDQGAVTAINHVGLESYLYSVVGSEVYASWPTEALKAQAVAARSFVLYRRDRNRDPRFDVGNSTTWQVYKGIASEAPTTIAAVNATAGQVLTYNNRVIEAVFHASSGGHTENVEDVWGKPLPYLRGVQDYDQNAPVFNWSQSFSVQELSAKLTGVGRILQTEPLQTTPFGRIRDLRITGDRGSRVVKGDEVRRALNLRSSLFTVSSEASSNWFDFLRPNPAPQPPSQFTIIGRGYGHGLGLSQWGAYGLASQGVDYRRILSHFYQNTNLSPLGGVIAQNSSGGDLISAQD